MLAGLPCHSSASMYQCKLKNIRLGRPRNQAYVQLKLLSTTGKWPQPYIAYNFVFKHHYYTTAWRWKAHCYYMYPSNAPLSQCSTVPILPCSSLVVDKTYFNNIVHVENES